MKEADKAAIKELAEAMMQTDVYMLSQMISLICIPGNVKSLYLVFIGLALTFV